MTDTTNTGGQTRDTQAIDALIEAVRGGAISTSLIEDAMDTSWEAVMVLAAFDGAMDAALGLFAELLPGWWAEIRISTRPRAKIGNIDAHTEEQAETPARALLLATLKAWKETMK